MAIIGWTVDENLMSYLPGINDPEKEWERLKILYDKSEKLKEQVANLQCINQKFIKEIGDLKKARTSLMDENAKMMPDCHVITHKNEETMQEVHDFRKDLAEQDTEIAQL